MKVPEKCERRTGQRIPNCPFGSTLFAIACNSIFRNCFNRCTIQTLTQLAAFVWTFWRSNGAQLWPFQRSCCPYALYWPIPTLMIHLYLRLPTYIKTRGVDMRRLHERGLKSMQWTEELRGESFPDPWLSWIVLTAKDWWVLASLLSLPFLLCCTGGHSPSLTGSLNLKNFHCSAFQTKHTSSWRALWRK